jgi:hypothetical protein
LTVLIAMTFFRRFVLFDYACLYTPQSDA